MSTTTVKKEKKNRQNYTSIYRRTFSMSICGLKLRGFLLTKVLKKTKTALRILAIKVAKSDKPC